MAVHFIKTTEHTVTAYRAEASLIDVTPFGGPRSMVIGSDVTVTLTDGEITVERTYRLGTEPRIGEQITVTIDEPKETHQ